MAGGGGDLVLVRDRGDLVMFWMCFIVEREREVTNNKEIGGALDCW